MIRYLLWILLLPQASQALFNIFRKCDYRQNVQENTKIKFSSPGYPNNYPPGTNCRWSAQSPVNTNIQLECHLKFLANTNCKETYIRVSDHKNIKSSRCYCGTGQFHFLSASNTLTVTLRSSSKVHGGSIYCTIEVQSRGSETQTQPPKIETPPKRSPASCSCGRTNSMRIVGGSATGKNQYPMMVGIMWLSSMAIFCGGTIISAQYVLTAAHCFERRNNSNVGLLVGGHDIAAGKQYDGIYKILEVLMHKAYNTRTKKNDICLLKTETNLTFSHIVGTACLPFKLTNTDLTGKTVMAVGWGNTSWKGKQPNSLLHVALKVNPMSDCKRIFGSLLGDQELCTFRYGHDSCQGDSGGPLFWKDPENGATVIVGVISYGLDCGAEFPAVNTKVSYYLDWIQSHTGRYKDC